MKTEGVNNSIFIGQKPLKNYINSIRMQIEQEMNSHITIKARGKFISKAVDIAELARRNQDLKLEISNILTNTEEYTKDDNQKIKVSTIEICLSKQISS